MKKILPLLAVLILVLGCTSKHYYYATISIHGTRVQYMKDIEGTFNFEAEDDSAACKEATRVMFFRISQAYDEYKELKSKGEETGEFEPAVVYIDLYNYFNEPVFVDYRFYKNEVDRLDDEIKDIIYNAPSNRYSTWGIKSPK